MGLEEGPPPLFCRATADTKPARPSLLQSRLLKTAPQQGLLPGLGSPARLCPRPRGRPGATGAGGGDTLGSLQREPFLGHGGDGEETNGEQERNLGVGGGVNPEGLRKAGARCETATGGWDEAGTRDRVRECLEPQATTGAGRSWRG